ncbi:MAG: Gfo/Idh/MocA family oxidoreductase [Deltaproteobacteria bacterium]
MTRVGVIGAGHMGQYHVNVYSEIPNVKLAGIADISKERVEAVAQRFKTKGYTDYRKLIGQVDAVTVAVPTAMHYEVAKDFLSAGIHVLLEKPITPTLKEAKELYSIAKKKKVILQVGHVERFNGAVQEVKKIIKNPLLVETRRIGPFVQRVQDDGVVLDLMIHDIDIVLNLVNSEIVKVNAVGGSVYTKNGDYANVQISFKNGCVASLIASRVSQEKVRTLAVSQKDVYISLDYGAQELNVHRQASSQYFLSKEELKYRQESMIERVFVHKDNPLKLEVKHFLDCVTKRAERALSPESDLRSLEVALKVQDILKKDGVIK